MKVKKEFSFGLKQVFEVIENNFSDDERLEEIEKVMGVVEVYIRNHTSPKELSEVMNYYYSKVWQWDDVDGVLSEFYADEMNKLGDWAVGWASDIWLKMFIRNLTGIIEDEYEAHWIENALQRIN